MFFPLLGWSFLYLSARQTPSRLSLVSYPLCNCFSWHPVPLSPTLCSRFAGSHTCRPLEVTPLDAVHFLAWLSPLSGCAPREQGLLFSSLHPRGQNGARHSGAKCRASGLDCIGLQFRESPRPELPWDNRDLNEGGLAAGVMCGQVTGQKQGWASACPNQGQANTEAWVAIYRASRGGLGTCMNAARQLWRQPRLGLSHRRSWSRSKWHSCFRPRSDSMWDCTAESTQLTPSSLPLACPPRIGGSSSLLSRASRTQRLHAVPLTPYHTHTHIGPPQHTPHNIYATYMHTRAYIQNTHTEALQSWASAVTLGAGTMSAPFAFWIKHSSVGHRGRRKVIVLQLENGSAFVSITGPSPEAWAALDFSWCWRNIPSDDPALMVKDPNLKIGHS